MNGMFVAGMGRVGLISNNTNRYITHYLYDVDHREVEVDHREVEVDHREFEVDHREFLNTMAHVVQYK